MALTPVNNFNCPVSPECETNERLARLETSSTTLQTAVKGLHSRIEAVETIGQDVGQILTTLDKVAKRLKIWAPSLIAAAISAGVVNGKLGAFLHALFNGAG